MSGFERADWSAAWPDAEELFFPDDFTADEAEFTHDLRAFYALERDEPPPLYAQTLLNSERPALAEPGFEQRVYYSVFRQLGLQRPSLVTGTWTSTLLWLRGVGRSMTDSISSIPRVVASASAAFMALMAITVVLASPSFAAGLRLLLGHTGVQQVSSYPGNVQASEKHVAPDSSVPTPDPLNEQTPLFWLGDSYGGYSYLGMRELSQPDWTQGPLVELQYTKLVTDGTTEVASVLDVREFQLSSQYSAVLQVVQADHASQVSINGNPAVYVDGKWLYYTSHLHFGRPPTWQTGEKSELILEYAGEIFWITGDQRYGVDSTFLMQAAQQIMLTHLQQLRPSKPGLHGPYQAHDPLMPNPGEGEVLALVPAGQAPDTGATSFVVDLSSFLND